MNPSVFNYLAKQPRHGKIGNSVKLVVLILICALSFPQLTLTQANSFCGDKSLMKDVCHQGCYDACEARIANEDLTKEATKVKPESIATQTNLCMDKCYGREFLPLKSEDIPILPHYSDAVDCLGRCAYPVDKTYCIEGYLSSFLYCDCHHCCLQKSDNKKCIRGCHLWFMRQWSPKPKHSCRYREDVQKSPRTWCTDFCIFMTLKRDTSLSWNDIPRITTSIAAPCIRRCTSLVLAGVPVDYDMDIVPCTDISKCVTIIVIQFEVFTNYDLDYAYALTKIGSQVDVRIAPSRVGNPTDVMYDTAVFQGKKQMENAFDVRRDPVLDRLHNLGIPVSVLWGAENDTQYPNTISATAPWESYSNALAIAYNYTSNPNKVKVKGDTFHSKRRFAIEPCTNLRTRTYINVAHDVRMDHKVSVKVADTKTLFPLTAVELRNAISLKPEWRNLEYVRDFDEYTIIMKGKGYANAKYGFSHKEEDICEPIQGCNYPRNPAATSFCRVVEDKSYIQGGAFLG